MKKPLFLFYSLMLLLVTVSVSSCKKGWGSDSTEHCTIFFEGGTKKEFDIDSKYQLNCGLEKDDSYPTIFHIYLNYRYPPKKKGESAGEWKSGSEDEFYTGDRCCVIDEKNVTKDGCLKEMKRLAKEIGDERMVEDSWCGDRCTLRFGSLENVIGYSYRFKDHERTIRILPEDESSSPIEYYTVFFKDGTKKEFSINEKYMLLWNMKLANDEVRKYTRSYSEIHPHTCEMDDYNDHDDFTGTHVITFDIYLKYTYDSYKENCVVVFNPDVLTTEQPTLRAEDCLGEMKRLANYLGDGKVEKHHDDDGVYTLSISSLKNVTGYSYRFKNYERTIRLF